MERTSIHNVYVLLLLMIAGLTACSYGQIDAEEAIRQAENELLFGHIEKAASNCDMLADSTSTTLSPTQLCRVALIYAKISECSKEEDYMASAAECFDRAVVMDKDTIEMYIESLNVEDQSYLRVIREVTRALNSPIDISREDDGEFEATDSIDAIEPDSTFSVNSNATAML